MTSTLQFRPLAPVGATFLRSIAASALLASTLFGAGAVQASLIVTSASGSASADTSGSELAFDALSAVGGVIHGAVESQVFLDTGDGALARAKLDAVNLPTQLFAAGEAELLLSDGVLGLASTNYSVLFTLTSRYQFSGTVDFQTSGSGERELFFEVRRTDGLIFLSATEVSPDIDVLLTLDPGDYIINTFARAANFDIDVSAVGSAGYEFNLTATDLGEPPLVVPEPHSLALVLAGLACGMVRRRRQIGI